MGLNQCDSAIQRGVINTVSITEILFCLATRRVRVEELVLISGHNKKNKIAIDKFRSALN